MGIPVSSTSRMTAFPAPALAGPGFMAMMEEVEDGNVEAIIIKDIPEWAGTI